MVGHDLSDEKVDRILIADPAFVNFGETRFLAAEIEMVEAAG